MDAIIQTRIDTKQKLAAQKLFKSMGTSLGEAIRMFVYQSLREQGMPFKPVADYTVNAQTEKELLAAKNEKPAHVFTSMQDAKAWLDKAYNA